MNTSRCPGLVGAFVPPQVGNFFPNATNFDPDAFYDYLSKELCRCGGQLIGKKWICSFILSMYVEAESACRQPSTVTTRLSCRSSCEATIGVSPLTALCTASNVTTLPILTCSNNAWPNDNNAGAQCEKNSFGGDKCTRPSFLNRSTRFTELLADTDVLSETANVPNWFWVILFPLLILIIAVAIIGFVLYRMKHDELSDTLNPCKWCECCPGTPSACVVRTQLTRTCRLLGSVIAIRIALSAHKICMRSVECQPVGAERHSLERARLTVGATF